MPEIQAVLDVTLNELSSEHQLILKEAVEQFQQKCLLSFSKNRSGVPFLRTDMPRVLMPGYTDAIGDGHEGPLNNQGKPA
jgi:hypothetical protein